MHLNAAWPPDCGTYARDRYFWSQCFAFFGQERTKVVDRTISAYNHFGPLYRVRKRVLGMRIEWDIHNLFLAKCYLMAADVRRTLRRRSGPKEGLPR